MWTEILCQVFEHIFLDTDLWFFDVFFACALEPWKFVALGNCSCGSKLCFHATAWLAISYLPLSPVTFRRRCSMLNRHCHCRKFYVSFACCTHPHPSYHPPISPKNVTTSIKSDSSSPSILSLAHWKISPIFIFSLTPSYHHHLSHMPSPLNIKKNSMNTIRIRKTKQEQQQKQNTHTHTARGNAAARVIVAGEKSNDVANTF